MLQPYTNFDVRGLKVVITGGGGYLCGAMAVELAALGAQVAVVDSRGAEAEAVAGRITAEGGEAVAITCDVTDPAAVRQACDALASRWGGVDALINGAGGNHPKASTSADRSFFDLAPDDVQQVFNLNFMGSFYPCQAIGRLMAERGEGVILNIASINASRPLTRIPAYAAAKAAISNFTQWLAVHMGQNYSPRIRVNAIAPGFFITDQSRFLLTNPETGGYSERGQQVIAHTPMGRFGVPEDLLGTVVWLLSPASVFVTGATIFVDGGFTAYTGV